MFHYTCFSIISHSDNNIKACPFSSMFCALNEKEVDGIAAMAHKLLPLFTMIGAEETIAPLKWLEACRGEEFSEKIEETTLNILEAVHKIISEAERYLIVMKNTR